MYTQSGGAEFTNYFTHKDRKSCEESVLNSIPYLRMMEITGFLMETSFYDFKLTYIKRHFFLPYHISNIDEKKVVNGSIHRVVFISGNQVILLDYLILQKVVM